MSEPSRKVCLTIRADLDEIPTVSAAIEKAMKPLGFPMEGILDLQLAVEESIANTIQHGYQGGEGEVAIIIETTPLSACVQIEDRAPPFDPLLLPEPEITPDIGERPIGGLGIYLMCQVVDEARYRYAEGKNILTLIKNKTA